MEIADGVDIFIAELGATSYNVNDEKYDFFQERHYAHGSQKHRDDDINLFHKL